MVPFYAQHAGEIVTSSEVPMEETPLLIQALFEMLDVLLSCTRSKERCTGGLLLDQVSDESWMYDLEQHKGQTLHPQHAATAQIPVLGTPHYWFIWNASPCPHQLVTALFSSAGELIISIYFGVLSEQLEQDSISSLSIVYIHYRGSRALWNSCLSS